MGTEGSDERSTIFGFRQIRWNSHERYQSVHLGNGKINGLNFLELHTVFSRENQVYQVPFFYFRVQWLSESKIFRTLPKNLHHGFQDADKALCDPEGATLPASMGGEPQGCETWFFRENPDIGSMGMLHWASVLSLDSDSWFLRWSRITLFSGGSDGIMGEKTGKFEGILIVYN